MSDEEIQDAIDALVADGVVTRLTVAEFKTQHLEGKFLDRLSDRLDALRGHIVDPDPDPDLVL